MTVFTACSRGHDLTAPGAYLVRNTGQRECRQCAIANGTTGRLRSTASSTWAEQRGEGREVSR